MCHCYGALPPWHCYWYNCLLPLFHQTSSEPVPDLAKLRNGPGLGAGLPEQQDQHKDGHVISLLISSVLNLNTVEQAQYQSYRQWWLTTANVHI